MLRARSLAVAAGASAAAAAWRPAWSDGGRPHQTGGQVGSGMPGDATTRVHKIVITGGPCAGKTTAMSKLSLRLQNLGFAVYVVPELATLTITGGASPATMARPEFLKWETAILKAQMELEDTFEEIARGCSAERHSVLLIDRGTMDVLAYMGHDDFKEVLEENNWTVPSLRDKRYNAVIHLQTAALGASEFYTLENNHARMEAPAEAIALDKRLSHAWVGHNRLVIIDNRPTGGFEDKMVRTMQAVCECVGAPVPRAKPRWWIVELRGAIDIPYAEWELEHMFLTTSSPEIKESRITRKVHAGATVYHHRLVGETIGDEVSRSERTISMREYKALKAQADPTRLPIRKTRRAFIWKNDYYMLDTFHEPRSAAGVTTLFVERPVDPNSPPDELPAFIKLREDVTTKVWFSSYDAWNRKVEGPKDEHAIG